MPLLHPGDPFPELSLTVPSGATVKLACRVLDVVDRLLSAMMAPSHHQPGMPEGLSTGTFCSLATEQVFGESDIDSVAPVPGGAP